MKRMNLLMCIKGTVAAIFLVTRYCEKCMKTRVICDLHKLLSGIHVAP